MTEKITREDIQYYARLQADYPEVKREHLKALCTLALQAEAMQPRPIEELPDGTWVLGWFVGDNAPEAAHMYSLIQQATDDSTMIWDGDRHRPKAWFTHFIPLTSLPEPRR